MAKKPNVPCAGGCGKLLWGGGRGSLPDGDRKCLDCRRTVHTPEPGKRKCGRCNEVRPYEDFTTSSQNKAGSWCRPCHAEYAREWNKRKAEADQEPRACTDCGAEASRRGTAHGRFCDPCALARKRARDSRKVSKRRTACRFTDITAQYERELRQQARRCPLCEQAMTGEPGYSNSKQLDHIIPIVLGGTHTIGNVRIICRTCNLTRPRNGSDLDGHQPTLWAQAS